VSCERIGAFRHRFVECGEGGGYGGFGAGFRGGEKFDGGGGNATRLPELARHWIRLQLRVEGREGS
ncbi:MAG: hypothetical protein ACO3UM_14400, partial [Planctomycetota bacterium]